VAVASAGSVAAAVELRSETDYVAKSNDFKALAQDLAEAAVAGGEEAVAALQPRIDDLRVSLKENIDVGRVVRFEGPDDAVVDTYLHVQNERGVSAVLVELVGGDRALAHEVALHVAAMRPEWLSRADVPPERVRDERELLTTLTRKEGKPEQALDKIVEGRLNGYFKDVALLEQPYVRDNKRTVAQLLGDARVTRFARVEIGA
jgi:elongation factor Ts